MDDEKIYKADCEELAECDDNCDTCEVRIPKSCQSCGMPMNSPADFGGGDEENSYCIHCTHPDGKLKSYDEIYEGMVFMYINKRNMERPEAERVARDYMAMMPAWTDYSPERI